MALNGSYKKYLLRFKFPAGTSRGTLYEKATYFLILNDTDHNITGIGECSVIPGLSTDDREDYPEVIARVCSEITEGVAPGKIAAQHTEFPSILFGLEMAIKDLEKGGKRHLFPGSFVKGERGIPINGLIWMGQKEDMWEQMEKKVDRGFRCLKMKIGAIAWEEEHELLKKIRRRYSVKELELRVDANGSFHPDRVLGVLEQLADLEVHSIEQPVQPGQWENMRWICENSPVPVALDEELIGINHPEDKRELLDTICPHYLILKPSLLGGFFACDEWIKLARKRNTGWWVTSALESNIGLNAIAQWVDSLDVILPQGLGTGELYTNNIPAPLEIKKGRLFYRPAYNWKVDSILQ